MSLAYTGSTAQKQPLAFNTQWCAFPHQSPNEHLTAVCHKNALKITNRNL